MKGKFRNGLKGGSNYIDPSVNGYQFDSPDFNNEQNLINSGRITMDKVPFPVMGEDNLGNRKIMHPNMEYQFPGSQVLETPMHKMPDGSMMQGESHGYCSECDDDDEYEYLELTDEEAEQYRLGGIILEDLTVLQDGGEGLPTKNQIANDPELEGWDKYNTKLSTKEKKSYDKWSIDANINPWDRGAYDSQGYWKDFISSGKGDIADDDGHRPDTYKKPNHPTFSNQSKYHAVDGNYGGVWTDDSGFQPSKQTLERYGDEYYTQPEVGQFTREPNRPEHLDLSRFKSGENKPFPLIYQNGGENEKKPWKNSEGGKEAYEKYKNNVYNFLENHKGEKYDLIDNGLLPSSFRGSAESESNCIGSSCNAMQESGADVTPTASNTNFWQDAERKGSNFDVLANHKTKDYINIINNLKPGDIIGHNYPNKSFGDRNGNYPEHSQQVLKVENGFVHVLEGQGSKGYYERKYPISKFTNEGGPYKNTWIARPNSFGGKRYRSELPSEKNPYFNKAVSDDVELDLKPMDWSKGLSSLKTYDLDEVQYQNANEIIKIVEDVKEDFIRKTGMSENDYDEIMQYIPSIANQETDLGNSIGARGLKKNPTRAIAEGLKTFGKEKTGGYASDGLMQVRDQYIDSNRSDNASIVSLAKKFGIKDKDYNPSDLKQNVLLSMFLINDVNKNVDKRFSKKGNNKNLSRVEKVLYDYNQYGAGSRGDADGLSTYVNNIVNGKGFALADGERKKLISQYNRDRKVKEEEEARMKVNKKIEKLKRPITGSKF